MCHQTHCSNSSPILELSVKSVSQICHDNINKPLDGAYLSDFGIDISVKANCVMILYLAGHCDMYYATVIHLVSIAYLPNFLCTAG